MKRKNLVLVLAVSAACGAFAQQTSGRNAFQGQQAMAEVQRVAAQVDSVQANLDDLAQRLGRLERGTKGSDIEALRTEVGALKAALADLRRDMQNQRSEIVNDLMKKLKTIQAAAPQPKPSKPAPTGPYKTYEVQSGDTLAAIADAAGVTVQQLRDFNGIKGDNIRIGQKIKVPVK